MLAPSPVGADSGGVGTPLVSCEGLIRGSLESVDRALQQVFRPQHRVGLGHYQLVGDGGIVHRDVRISAVAADVATRVKAGGIQYGGSVRYCDRWFEPQPEPELTAILNIMTGNLDAVNERANPPRQFGL